ncbi:MAG: glycine--tRNA ligase subunit beta [Chloroflexota bacterium]|nr:glycine--tRNA ligase subunit beta [Chloroflexota bacterium]
MKNSLDFQSIIMKLQEFWAARDCLVWQPYYSQVGAGTMNPATFLRVLGPEPWKVAYVEPSIRPDDGRYGVNPNRLHQFYQFQVILKPDPGNPQEVYLESLQALGIDPYKHDIRFVEDNWQQPAIGAWGLGWEVWLDGQEITQFTYFQQCGGQVLDPVSVELTYGLERIAMTLQGVRHFKDIQWSPERTYGDVNLMGEREHSTYYFNLADVESMRKLYEMYEREAQRAIEAGLVLPAHDYVLKTSHTFNILDARGAVGVTERQALFGRTRELARRVAQAYIDQRQQAEFPWLVEKETKTTPELEIQIRDIDDEKALFLLEIGTEELPSSDLNSALSQLEKDVPKLLDRLRLTHGLIRVWGTPRRLVVIIEDLVTSQSDLTMEVKGPPADRAYDTEGHPTRAAEGFARSKGIDVADLKVARVDGGEYVVAQVKKAGQSSQEVLGEALPGLIADIRFNKSMRWNDSGVAFSRPIRWLLSLHDKVVVPFNFAGCTSGRKTRGYRFAGVDVFEAESPQDYLQKISAQGILLDPAARQAEIKRQADALAGDIGGHIPDDPALLEEVTNLVERPTAFRGTFDKSYLDQLPPDVLISVMKKHQRYFVTEDKQGKLMPYFVGVRNGAEEYLDNVVDGNEQVILARFDDAAFFIEKDLQHPLEDFVTDLSTLTFQIKLGSFLDKTHRITNLVESIGARLALSKTENQTTGRAAELCKADLATNMVVEMTSLQGIMGRYYALRCGEKPAVAEAIFEHYLPRFAGDRSPQSKPGLILSLADRVDSLVGLFAVGLAPTGTKDPFAQRRAALGICQNLMEWQCHFDLHWGLAEAAHCYDLDVKEKDLAACFDFIQGRLRGMLLESGFRYDVVDAVLAKQAQDPYGTLKDVQTLSNWVAREDWNEILPAYSRCVRITRDQEEIYSIDESLLMLDPERLLYAALIQAESDLAGLKTVEGMLKVFLPMVPVINRFFDEVLVMAEEDAVRENRLALLQRISSLSRGIMDMSYLEGF